MKLLLLPKQLFLFWYPEALVVILRSWRNSISYLEEDLAVGLMWKLLFTPLFHDSSGVGAVLSFVFRLTRVLLGLFAFSIVSLVFILIALIWLSLPLSAIFITGTVGWLLKILLFSGLVIFIQHLFSHPLKKVWQLKSPAEIWTASLLKSDQVDLYKLLDRVEVKDFLEYLETTPAQLRDLLQELHGVQIDQSLILKHLFDIGRELKVRYFSAEYFLVATLLNLPGSEQLLLKINITPQDLKLALDLLATQEKSWRKVFLWDEEFAVKHLKGVNRGWLSSPTPTLDLVSEDLTKKASYQGSSDFIGRSSYVHQVVRVLSQEQGRNVLLLGEPGSGKSHLVEFLAKSIISGDAPEALATKRLVKLDTNKLLSGEDSDVAAVISKLFEELKGSGNIIVFIDEIHNLYHHYSKLSPLLDSSDLQFIATSEASSYSRIIEKDGDFARMFQRVDLPPASKEETVEVLKNLVVEQIRAKGVKTSSQALLEIVSVAENSIHNKVLPDSALSLFRECQAEGSKIITQEVVDKVATEMTHIPVGNSSQKQKSDLLNLEQIIHQDFINQEEAVKVVADTLRRVSVNLKEKNHPLGSFLFVGPTGVGKTELAKRINTVFFEGKGAYLRFDMSEFQTISSVDRLIGSESQEGLLSEAVRNNPYGLILLDEFEKADPKLLNIFLQILDDARLTDGSGRVVDFTNTIIIATSNAASLTIAKGIQRAEDPVQLKKEVDSELLTIFKPELINRFDSVVMFHPLSQENLQKIVRLKLAALQKTLLDQGYQISFSEELVLELAHKGFDPVMGARPLRRLIQDTLESKLSRLILEGKLRKGEMITLSTDVLSVDVAQ